MLRLRISYFFLEVRVQFPETQFQDASATLFGERGHKQSNVVE